MALYADKHLFPRLYEMWVTVLNSEGKRKPEKIELPNTLTLNAVGLIEEGLNRLTRAERAELALYDFDEGQPALLHRHAGVSMAVTVLELMYRDLR